MFSRFERFSYAVTQISRHMHKIMADEMEKYGLKGAHSIYLLTLAQFPMGLTSPQICDKCGKDKSDVSRMMRIMEQKGIVQKEGGHQNRYGGAFRLTERGLEMAQHIRNRASLAVELAGSALTVEQRENMYRALELIVEGMRKISENGLPENNEQGENK